MATLIPKMPKLDLSARNFHIKLKSCVFIFEQHLAWCPKPDYEVYLHDSVHLCTHCTAGKKVG